MTVENVIRVLALLALVALYVSDQGMALWIKPVGTEVYLALFAVVLGVDINWARGVFKAWVLRNFNVAGAPADREDGKGE